MESSAKKTSVKIFSQFLKFSVFRAQFSGSHYGNSQFRSEIVSIKESVTFIQKDSINTFQPCCYFWPSASSVVCVGIETGCSILITTTFRGVMPWQPSQPLATSSQHHSFSS